MSEIKLILILVSIYLLNSCIFPFCASTLCPNISNITNINNIARTSNITAPSEDLYKTYDFGKGDDCTAMDIDSNNCIYLAGASNYWLNTNNWSVIKLDTLGNKVWKKSWGPNQFSSIITDIAVDTHLNTYIVGNLWLNNTKNNLIKLSNTGGHLFTINFNIEVNIQSIVLDSFNQVYLAGYIASETHYDVILMKYDEHGNHQWNRTWIGDMTDLGLCVDLDSENNIFVGGITNTGVDKIVLLKYNQTGELVWSIQYEEGYRGYCNDVLLDSNDNLYVMTDKTLLNFGKKGELEWSLPLGYNIDHRSGGIEVDTMDSVYVAGNTVQERTKKILLLNCDNDGNLISSELLPLTEDEGCNDIDIDDSDRVYLAGSKKEDFLLIRYTYVCNSVIYGYNLLLLISLLFLVSMLIQLKIKLKKKF